jgi:predicted O-linked N-acetylglucosamine transferase (SPINDLY family)
MNDLGKASTGVRAPRRRWSAKGEAPKEWLRRGNDYQQGGRPIDALICYQRTLQLDTRSIEARFRLGEVLHEVGRKAEALAMWNAGLELDPAHVPTLLALAGAARQGKAYEEAITLYRRALAASPKHPEAPLGIAMSRLAQGNEAGYAEMAGLLGAKTSPWFWTELAQVLALARPSPLRTSLLLQIVATQVDAMPPLLLACAAIELIAAGDIERARALLLHAESQAAAMADPETLRRLTLVAAALGSPLAWSERYARCCMASAARAPSLLWPRRTFGAALRVAYLVAPGVPVTIDGVEIDTETYLRTIVAAHSPERIAAMVCTVGVPSVTAASGLLPPEVPVVALGPAPDAVLARSVAEFDPDAIVDLVGCSAVVGPLLASRPARTRWTYPGLAAANVAPLVTHALPPPAGSDGEALARHRNAIEQALLDGCTHEPWWADVAPRSAAELGTLWHAAVAAHLRGDLDAAVAGYSDVLAEQPNYAPGQYLFGRVLRGRGQRAEAQGALAAAVGAAPDYVEARAELADLLREEQRPAQAAALCQEGLRRAPNDASLLRVLGLALLAQGEGTAARKAFHQALALAPAEAMTHYNEGVALQLLRNRKAALRSYQRALALDPQLTAAYFNIGVIFREQRSTDLAIAAFEQVLTNDAWHVPAHKALAETLQGERRLGAWLQVFDHFEAACPDAFPLLVMALEACQYRADFAKLDRYLDRLRRDEFKPRNEVELADCLEELLFLMLYFDLEPEVEGGLYKVYDSVARRVYGTPLPAPAERRAGRIRIGYLSGDLRNHVMGKMMFPALERHDRRRFELFFYSLSDESDEWTERYRALGDHFEVIAELPESDAARRIASDDLDILVDLATHTQGARPGILAFKPARVQITHIASAGAVGLSTIDFKLTDAYADLPESQAFLLETLLPMGGCVYPYHHIAPALSHAYRRDLLGLAPDAVIIGAFVNPLKLSRRCLALWREVLERIPKAVLAISPMSPERRVVYSRLFSAAGIEEARVCVVPQGRDDEENQARYGLIDFVLDPMPYGGVNGTLEALDMSVPVVTLVGRRHSERSSYSILTNLGVTQTIAASGSEFVSIAVRLATDPAFMAEVKAAIASGLEQSPLTDIGAYTRHLEEAYRRALELRCPGILAAAGEG